MIDGTYFIEVDTPLGRKSGTAELATQGDVLEACVKAPIIGTQKATGTVDGNTFSAAGSLKIPLKGKLNYTIVGEVDGDIVTAQFKSDKGNLMLIGARM